MSAKNVVSVFYVVCTTRFFIDVCVVEIIDFLLEKRVCPLSYILIQL